MLFDQAIGLLGQLPSLIDALAKQLLRVLNLGEHLVRGLSFHQTCQCRVPDINSRRGPMFLYLRKLIGVWLAGLNV